MKIWISGASGYIGINLRKHLQELDCTHFNFDATMNYDIMDQRKVFQTMKGYDVAIHLAALGDTTYCERNIDEAVEINIIGTMNVTQSTLDLQIPLVYPSTFAAKTAHNVYGLTKRLAELCVLNAHGVVLRLANVYGGFGYLTRKKTAMANFVGRKKAGIKAEIRGDGSATRDFIHVNDVCQAVIVGMGAAPGIYDICTGHQTSIKDLADMIGVEYEFMPPQNGLKELLK
jgi:UDP-glucose 4-epimerase